MTFLVIHGVLYFFNLNAIKVGDRVNEFIHVEAFRTKLGLSAHETISDVKTGYPVIDNLIDWIIVNLGSLYSVQDTIELLVFAVDQIIHVTPLFTFQAMNGEPVIPFRVIHHFDCFSQFFIRRF